MRAAKSDVMNEFKIAFVKVTDVPQKKVDEHQEFKNMLEKSRNMPQSASRQEWKKTIDKILAELYPKEARQSELRIGNGYAHKPGLIGAQKLVTQPEKLCKHRIPRKPRRYWHFLHVHSQIASQ